MRQTTHLQRWLAYAVLDQSIRTPRKPRRIFYKGPARLWRYREWIRSQGCCCGCGRPPRSEFAHTGDDGGTGEKASDWSGVPLSWKCHLEYHDHGKREFERRHNISFLEITRQLQVAWRNREWLTSNR